MNCDWWVINDSDDGLIIYDLLHRFSESRCDQVQTIIV